MNQDLGAWAVLIIFWGGLVAGAIYLVDPAFFHKFSEQPAQLVNAVSADGSSIS